MLTLEQFRTPGQYIQKLLEDRGWTQRVLAIVLGVDETGLNKIITGKRPLDAGLSLSLSAIFDVPAETFLQLQKDYDLALARLVARPDPALADRARLFGGLPITEMVKRGWLPALWISRMSQSWNEPSIHSLAPARQTRFIALDMRRRRPIKTRLLL